MSLAKNFIFSQSNLQDYCDCPRRFELRWLLKLQYPALQSEPVLEQERHMELGERFHQMVHRHQLGLSQAESDDQTLDPDLALWWEAYLIDSLHKNLPPLRKPEFEISIPFCAYRLVARYDLLSYEPGVRSLIVDWKTGKRRLSRKFLQARIQTRVYPLVFALGGAFLHGGTAPDPQSLQMVYWFPESPDAPEWFSYSQERMNTDRHYLETLVQEISILKEGEFPLTFEGKNCLFCNYRSLCSRGVRAGDLSNAGEEFLSSKDNEPQTLDFDQMDEIAF